MNWGLISSVPYLTCLAAIIAATVTDIKKREVPDWVSYGLIVLGVLFSAATSFTLNTVWALLCAAVFISVLFLVAFQDQGALQKLFKTTSLVFEAATAFFIIALGIGTSLLITNWHQALANSILGLSVGFAIGALLYYTGQWGGGDAKLLAGIGSVMTLPLAWILQLKHPLQATPVPFFVYFIGLLVVCGMIYGIAWMVYLIIKNWKRFLVSYTKQLKSYLAFRIAVWVLVLVCFAGALYYKGLAAGLFILLGCIIFCSFYLIVAIRIAENEFMLKKVKAKQLTEGDWVVGGVKLGNHWIIPKKNIGATKQQIATLKKRAPNKQIIIKEGIPFVPSFLAACILALV